MSAPDQPQGSDPGAPRPRPAEPGPGPAAQDSRALDRSTLRSLVVEANDGVIATTGVVEGFVASGWGGTSLVLAALCSMVAGGIALGGGRYAEEVSEREARLALIAEEREQLARSPQEEFDELVDHYTQKGLRPELAREVVTELTAANALAAHVDAEHHLTLEDDPAAPLVVGGAAGLAYASGALIPLMAVLLAPDDLRPQVTLVASLVALTLTSILQSRIGASSLARTLTRTVTVALTATVLSLLAGWLLHA